METLPSYPCTDGHWQKFKSDCETLRKYLGGGEGTWVDDGGRLAGEHCCQFCPG